MKTNKKVYLNKLDDYALWMISISSKYKDLITAYKEVAQNPQNTDINIQNLDEQSMTLLNDIQKDLYNYCKVILGLYKMNANIYTSTTLCIANLLQYISNLDYKISPKLYAINYMIRKYYDALMANIFYKDDDNKESNIKIFKEAIDKINAVSLEDIVNIPPKKSLEMFYSERLKKACNCFNPKEKSLEFTDINFIF